MSITGRTNTCQILTNTPFVLSGLSQTNLSTINITDVNGLDVSQCFGITSKIVTVSGTNVILSGDCNTSLEINITEGVTNPVECLYTAVTQQQNGILLFNFVDGTISDNIHPECCTALEGFPEIGPKNYYICRTVPEICIECCSAYTPTNTFEGLYQIFDFVTGGTVTTVPSAQCCYDYGFVESIVGDQIKCIEYVTPDPCEGLIIVEPVPQYGDITFVNPSTNVQTTLVPTAECCTSLGYSYAISGTKFTCFNSIASPPTVIITNDSCCLQTQITYYYAFARECTDSARVSDGVLGDVVVRTTTNITNWSHILIPRYFGDTGAVFEFYAGLTTKDNYDNNAGDYPSIDLDTITGVEERTSCSN